MDGVRSVRISYDPKCEELARYFLPEANSDSVNRLAGIIQQIIENFIEYEY
jgi:polysaccharide pyruvyl transferase WcaK-like protein